MSAFAFLVHHRTVDLVSMTASRAMRHDLGMGEDLVGLRRDDAYVLEAGTGQPLGDPVPWSKCCTSYAHWFNPNKHRFAFFEAEPGVVAGVRDAQDFPAPWLGRMLFTDRPDLDPSRGESGLSTWSGHSGSTGTHALTIASWDRETPVEPMPHGSWPDGGASLVRLQLWSLEVCANSEGEARDRVEACTVTRERGLGLLVNPHMEGWAFLPESPNHAERT